MTPFFIQSTEQPVPVESHRVLSIYLFQPQIIDAHFESELVKEINCPHIYDAVHLVGFEDNLEQARLWLTEGSVGQRLKGRVRDFPKTTAFITFDQAKGQYLARNLDGGPIKNASSMCEAERRNTLMRLFSERGGLEEAPLGFHYAKPSKAHADKFLRVSNVLEHFASTPILAFWLTEYAWDFDVEFMIVDTSGIASVAYALAHEISARKKTKNFPLVASHGSYGGLKNLQIHRPEQTLLIISASTSGGLKQELVKLGAVSENIVTLFYLDDKAESPENIICNLKHDGLTDAGYPPIENHYPEAECKLCKNNSYPISLEGDQFSFEPPEVKEIPINLRDLPATLARQIDELAGINFFRVHRHVDESLAEITFDIEMLFDERAIKSKYIPTQDAMEKFHRLWRRQLVRSAPLNLRHIVYCSYPYSKQIADRAAQELGQVSGKSFSPIDSKGLRDEGKSDNSSALVLTACLDDAKELNGIHLTLRDVQPLGNISYLTPIFKADSESDRKRVRSNLTFGEHNAGTFSLLSLYELPLPENPTKDSWSAELDLLNDFQDWLDKQGKERPNFLSDRIQLLLNAPKTGLTDQIFLPGVNGNELEVRSDFTLLRTKGGTRKLSQADIFVVVSSLLRALRTRDDTPKHPKLAYGPYRRAVLEPGSLERFSDGVIQAAILRAVRGYELTYANCDKKTSRRMRDVIQNLLDAPGNGGEALPEFILALGLRRLTLHPEHEQQIYKAVIGSEKVGQEIKSLVEYIVSESSTK